MKRELGVVETGLEDVEFKTDMCSVTAKNVMRFFGQDN